MVRPDETRTIFAMQADREFEYDVQITGDLFSHGLAQLRDRIVDRRVLFVASPTVARLYGNSITGYLRSEGVDVCSIVLPCAESEKTLEQVTRICDFARRESVDRETVLLACGGGVVMDLVTLAASWLRRGIRHMRIPTTLIGQIDAGVGVKGAINFRGKKSFLGDYYPAEYVLIAPELLATLGTAEIRCGLAESVKMALVNDRCLFELLERHGACLLTSKFQSPKSLGFEIVQRSALRMLECLQSNLYEDKTYERIVDFGHTISPLVESKSEFSIPHGDAVSIDIALSCALATELQLMAESDCERVLELLRRFGLPSTCSTLSEDLCKMSFGEARRHRGGKINLVVPDSIGSARFLKEPDEVPDSALRSALDRLGIRLPTKKQESEKSDDMCLVFDIGGTHLRAAAYHADTGRVTNVTKAETPNYLRHPELSMPELLELFRETLVGVAERVFSPWSAA